jgi:hypothetical protein
MERRPYPHQANFRFGSSTSFRARVSNFRSYPRSRHSLAPQYPSFRANKRQSALQQRSSYSITSSASTCIEGGTSKPSALAVLRLSIVQVVGSGVAPVVRRTSPWTGAPYELTYPNRQRAMQSIPR